MKKKLTSVLVYVVLVLVVMLLYVVLAAIVQEFISAFGVNLTFYQAICGAFLILVLGGWFNDRSK